jgi:predicted DNA-binding transcriptional regulator AlpA
MGKQKFIQFIGVSPEEHKKEIVEELLEEIKLLFEQFKPKPPLKWISRKQASKKLGKSYPTLNIWNKKGVLKAHKIGGTVMYKESDIEEILNSN